MRELLFVLQALHVKCLHIKPEIHSMFLLEKKKTIFQHFCTQRCWNVLHVMENFHFFGAHKVCGIVRKYGRNDSNVQNGLKTPAKSYTRPFCAFGDFTLVHVKIF